MSDFVQFPEEKYDPDAFKGFTATGPFELRTALAMMGFAQLAYEVDNTGGNATTGKIERIKDRWGFRDALLRLLQPPGHGSRGSAFRLIPPVVRQHLQDRCIAALTPA
jgi:hypothetical protein